MQCMTCSADIPPQWVKAIQSNECPGCGGEIMNNSAKELLTELTSAMERMPNNPQGIAGWLMSNYRFAKIGDAIPTEKFHVKPDKNNNTANAISSADQLLAKNKTTNSVFRDIAETKNKVNDKLSAMAKVIAEENIDENMYGNGSSELVAEINSNEESEEVLSAEFIAEQNPPPAKKQSLVLLEGTGDLTNPSIHLSDEELKAAYLAAGGAMEGSLEDEEILSTNPVVNAALHEQRLKRVQSQENFLSGSAKVRRK